MAAIPTDPNQAIDPFAQLANFFTSTEGGRANGRATQAMLDLQEGQLANQQFGQTSTNATAGGTLANQQYGQKSKNALDEANFQMDAPNKLAGQSVRGDILANAQDANITAPPGVPMGTITGGLRPSMFSDSTRQLGGNMARQALLNEMAGPKIDFPDAPALPTYPTAPALPTMPQASALDTGLNVAGGIAGGASALNNLLKALGVGSGPGSGGSGDLGPLGSALKKLFGGTSGTSGTTNPPGTGVWQDPNNPLSGLGPGQGPLLPVGPEQPGPDPSTSTGLTQDEIDALNQIFPPEDLFKLVTGGGGSSGVDQHWGGGPGVTDGFEQEY